MTKQLCTVFLKVDDIDITAMKHMDAVNVLRGTKRDVKLAVLRRTEGVSTSREWLQRKQQQPSLVDIRAVYTRENKPRITQSTAYVSRELLV